MLVSTSAVGEPWSPRAPPQRPLNDLNVQVPMNVVRSGYRTTIDYARE